MSERFGGSEVASEQFLLQLPDGFLALPLQIKRIGLCFVFHMFVSNASHIFLRRKVIVNIVLFIVRVCRSVSEFDTR